MHIELDLRREIEQTGVVLDKPMICGKCISEMNSVSKGSFQCPSCRQIYNG